MCASCSIKDNSQLMHAETDSICPNYAQHWLSIKPVVLQNNSIATCSRINADTERKKC